MFANENEDNFLAASHALTHLRLLRDTVEQHSLRESQENQAYIGSLWHDRVSFMYARLLILADGTSGMKTITENAYICMRFFEKVLNPIYEEHFDLPSVDELSVMCESMLCSKDANHVLAVTSFIKMLAEMDHPFSCVIIPDWDKVFMEYYHLLNVVGSNSLILDTYKTMYDICFESALTKTLGQLEKRNQIRIDPTLLFYNTAKYLYKKIENGFDD